LLAGVAIAAALVLTSGPESAPAIAPPRGSAAAATVAAAAAPAPAPPAPVEPVPAPAAEAAPVPADDNAATVTITITSGAGPAEVSIDDHVVGTTPYKHSLIRGKTRHRVEVRRSGMATFRKTITADEDQSIEATLIPRSARSAPPAEETAEPTIKPMPAEPNPPVGVDGAGSASATTNDDLSGGRY
jgi:hypothetical protein